MSAPLCIACGQHAAIFVRKQRRRIGRSLLIVKHDEDHDLCVRCWRSAWDREQARALAESQQAAQIRYR